MKARRNNLIEVAEPVVVAPPFREGVPGRLRRVDRVDQVAGARGAQGWGWLPALSLVCALALALVSIAFNRSRAGAGWAEPLFWAGLLMIVVPITARQASAEVPRRERIGLVIVLGLTLYLVKVMHSPFAFTFPDEQKQIYNVNQILQNQHLFHNNFALPVTSLYPGLATVTAALVSLSGLPVFSAGIVVMGLARLVLTLALYLFHEQVSGSARVAGIAAAIYIANPNYVYYIAEFSYEALALPIAALVLFVVARREDVSDGAYRLGLTLAALVGLLAVVISHHMTSYALVAFLWGVSVLYSRLVKDQQRGTWGLAFIALVATLAWLAYVASLTIGYLAPVFMRAVGSIIGMIAREETGRQLFRSTTGYVVPLWERLAALGSVFFILLGLPFGLRQIWRRYRGNPFALMLAGAAVTYFPMLALRFTRAGWETSNRSSEFLFVGISFVLALGFVGLRMPQRVGSAGRMLFTGYVALIFVGGMIAGWSPALRLAQPYLIAGSTQTVEPQGVFTAKWVRSFLGPDNRIAADQSNAELLLSIGEQEPLTGGAMGIQSMMLSNRIDRSVEEILQYSHTQYILSDRRRISWDKMAGLYFDRMRDDMGQGAELIDPEAFAKFDRQKNVSRIFDSGNIRIYDVGVLSGVPSTK